MTTVFLQTHVLVVILCLLLFLYKAGLLLFNQHNALVNARRYTKMLDIVFGTLILVSGAYLAYQYPGTWPGWLVIKMVLVLASIPLAIVGIKKHNKVLTALALLMFGYVYGVAETKSLKMRPDIEAETPASVANEIRAPEQETAATPNPILNQMAGTQLQNTKAIYAQLCATCHGPDGQKGTGGATNLQKSTLSAEARKEIIANGRGLMPAYRSQLTDQEIEALAQYSTILAK